MQIDPVVHDAGLVPQGTVVEAVFTPANHFRKPLTIDRTWASCSCTVPKCGKDQLQPGETTEVRTTWSTKSIRGDRSIRPIQP